MFKQKPKATDLPVGKHLTQETSEKIELRAAELFSMQWVFFRDGYYLMMKAAIAESVVIILLVLVIFLMAMQGSPTPNYFSVDPSGRISKLEPISMPALTDEQIRQFVVDAIGDSMNFNYLNYQDVIEKASKYFTDEGFVGYKKALVASTLTEQIVSKKLLLKTVVVGAPVIDESKNYGGRHVWIVRAKTIRTLTDRGKSADTEVVFTFYMYRVPSTERASQVAIYQIKQDFGGESK
jgi:hypothetical protein